MEDKKMNMYIILNVRDSKCQYETKLVDRESRE